MGEPRLDALELRIGMSFANRGLLAQALTHASASLGDGGNERLEFLGDAVVSLAVNDHLYRCYTQCREGTLTEIKSAAVSAGALARRARALGLAELAKLGKGMDPSALSDAVLANLFESLVGAIYLDAGYEAARDFVLGQLADEIEAAAGGDKARNFKAELQKLAAVRLGELPRYRLVSVAGPEHGKIFEVEVVLKERAYPPARGRTKKEAEQGAAANALEALRTGGELVAPSDPAAESDATQPR